jgi:hypothetical protein
MPGVLASGAEGGEGGAVAPGTGAPVAGEGTGAPVAGEGTGEETGEVPVEATVEAAGEGEPRAGEAVFFFKKVLYMAMDPIAPTAIPAKTRFQNAETNKLFSSKFSKVSILQPFKVGVLVRASLALTLVSR